MEKNLEKKARILLIGNSHLVIFKFRKELVKQLVADGYDVWVTFPNGPFGEGDSTSKQFGCSFIETKMNRRGCNPFQEFYILFQYIKLLRQLKPDVVLAYTVKPDIYGGFACRLLKVPFMPNITGLGKGIDNGGLIKAVTVSLYRIALRGAKCVFFQNDKDKAFFENNRIKYLEGYKLPGSGVNLQEFVPFPYPNDDIIRFTYIARVMKTKGIEEFLNAAKYIKSKYQNTEFHICGYCEEEYEKILEQYQNDKIIVYHGLVNNIIDFERASNCIVLPTFHPEGISNVLLEAAACARPIITTKRPGCRETVDDGISGYLVNECDSDDLIQKIEMFMELSHEQQKEMGEFARRKMESEFSRDIVVREYMTRIANTLNREIVYDIRTIES